MSTLPVSCDRSESRHGDRVLQAEPGDDKCRGYRKGGGQNHRDICRRGWRQILKNAPKPPRDLHVPHLGYKLPVAVSSQPTGEAMRKLVAFVRRGTIAGGAASW